MWCVVVCGVCGVCGVVWWMRVCLQVGSAPVLCRRALVGNDKRFSDRIGNVSSCVFPKIDGVDASLIWIKIPTSIMALHGPLHFGVHVAHVLWPKLGVEAQIVAHFVELHSALRTSGQSCVCWEIVVLSNRRLSLEHKFSCFCIPVSKSLGTVITHLNVKDGINLV